MYLNCMHAWIVHFARDQSDGLGKNPIGMIVSFEPLHKGRVFFLAFWI